MTTFPFPVEAVIFDMDGLLLDTESVYRAAMIASALAMGYDFPDDFCQSMVGTAEAEIHHMLQQRFGADFPIARLFADCEAEMGRRLDAGVPVKAGAAELIGELAARKLPMAVATSTVRRIAEHHLQRAGLLDHFAAVCTREDVTRGKPHPDIFLAAAGKLRRARRALHRVGGFVPRRARRPRLRRDGDHGAGHAAGDRRIAGAVRRGGPRPARGAHDVE